MPMCSILCDPRRAQSVQEESELVLVQGQQPITSRAGEEAPPARSLEEGKHQVPACAICLETSGPSVKVMLSCGHVYCWSCISEYVLKQREETRVASCPQCKKELQKHELAICLSSDAAEQLIQEAAARPPDAPDCQGQAGSSTDDALAEAVPHAKLCPACGTPIEKNGGCDHMTCRCGHEFLWSEVPALIPCDDINPHPKFPLWGRTSPGCSWKATAKLGARRTGIVAVGVVAVPFVLVGGVLVLVAAAGYNLSLAAKSRLPGSTMDRVYEARQFENSMLRAMNEAEESLRMEQRKWFNGSGIEAAQKRMEAARSALEEARGMRQELEADLPEAQRLPDEEAVGAPVAPRLWWCCA